MATIEMYDSNILVSWADAVSIIEQHAPHASVHEGCEGLEWEVEAASSLGEDAPSALEDAASPLENAAASALVQEEEEAEEEAKPREPSGGAVLLRTYVSTYVRTYVRMYVCTYTLMLVARLAPRVTAHIEFTYQGKRTYSTYVRTYVRTLSVSLCHDELC